MTPALRRILGPPELPGRLWCWRVTSFCQRCGAGVGVLCQKLCQHPLPKVILLPADKHSNARRFRYLTPRKRAPRSVFASNDTLPDATREALLKAFDEGKDFTSTDVGQ